MMKTMAQNARIAINPTNMKINVTNKTANRAAISSTANESSWGEFQMGDPLVHKSIDCNNFISMNFQYKIKLIYGHMTNFSKSYTHELLSPLVTGSHASQSLSLLARNIKLWCNSFLGEIRNYIITLLHWLPSEHNIIITRWVGIIGAEMSLRPP